MKTRINRRNFVATTGAGALAAPTLSWAQAPQVLTRGPAKPVVIASTNGNESKDADGITCVAKAFDLMTKGGDVLDAVMPHLKANARVPICGQISQYNSRERQGLRNVGVILDKCVKLQGFRIGNHQARRDQALGELMAWYRAGRLKWRETVAEGFEQAPAALINMLSGGNIGKQLVRLRAAAE